MSSEVPREALRAIFVALSGLPASRVIWDGEPKQFPGRMANGKSGMLVLDHIATAHLGVDQETEDFDVPTAGSTTVTYSGYRVRSIQVKAENYEGYGVDFLEILRMRIQGDDYLDALTAAGLSINDIGNVNDIGGSEGNRRVAFATVDLLFNQNVSIVEVVTTKNYINELEATGGDDLTRAGVLDVKGAGQA